MVEMIGDIKNKCCSRTIRNEILQVRREEWNNR
jgi:hypothetical protein